jgi:ferric-chelate reductase (NADPH)
MSAIKKAMLGVVGNSVVPLARLTNVEAVGDRFRLIDIESRSLQGAAWQPGSKVKVDVGDWEMRTYTPISIDPVRGRLQILAYGHGRGPASRWAMSAQKDTPTHIMGPRPSLGLTHLRESAVFFGDETSIAAALTLQTHLRPALFTSCVFEVSSAAEAEVVLGRLGLRDATLIEKSNDGSHIETAAAALRAALPALGARCLVMTGSGPSIQKVRAALRAANNPDIQYQVKAYWTHGKTGLD